MKNQKKKAQMIKDFGLLLKAKPTTDELQEEIKPEDQRGYLDPANVCMIIPLKKWVRETIINLYDAGEPSKVPELDYKKQESGMPSTSKYSMEYLRMMLKLADYYESVELSVKHEYPLSLKTKDFVIILAPRIDTD